MCLLVAHLFCFLKVSLVSEEDPRGGVIVVLEFLFVNRFCQVIFNKLLLLLFTVLWTPNLG